LHLGAQDVRKLLELERLVDAAARRIRALAVVAVVRFLASALGDDEVAQPVGVCAVRDVESGMAPDRGECQFRAPVAAQDRADVYDAAKS
jgi:hypothetical protein